MRLSTRGLGTARYLGCLLVLLCGAGGVFASSDKADVRVLIDISGSMRQNDPNNLRRPALRMLAGLLQPGTRAGVWTFARRADNLVPVSDVDAAWKARTQSLSQQIGSPGQFTNIEEVLDQASRDWAAGAPATHARHLLLLTDGMVDVSKQPAENARSRQRILDGLLPRIKAADVRIHTIALSERADHALLERLAAETGGWYQQVDEAEELKRVFLRMFEKVATPDAVPLKDNRFTVDSSVNEATVLVFSKPDSPPVVLHSPAGTAYRDSHLPDGVAWYRDQGYDLITIASPHKGEWHLEAEVDPDNRVLIVTDLELQISEVPTHIAAGEQTRIEAHLSNRGKLVDRRAFLRLLELYAEAGAPQRTVARALNDRGEDADERAQDGRYTMLYGEEQAHAEVELLIAVDSPTFMREKRFRLVVHEPLAAEVKEGPAGPALNLQLGSAVLAPEAALQAWQETGDGQVIALQLAEASPGLWQAPLADAALPVFARLSGTSRLGNPIERSIGPLSAPGVAPPPTVEPLPPAPDKAAAPADPPPSEAAAEPAEQASWIMPALLFGAFNLALLAGGAAWWMVRRRRAAEVDEFADLVDAADAVGQSRQEAA